MKLVYLLAGRSFPLYELPEVIMSYASSSGFGVLVCMWPFLFFYLWVAFQLMNPRQHCAPEVPMWKIILIFLGIVPLTVFLLLFVVSLPVDAVPAKMTPAKMTPVEPPEFAHPTAPIPPKVSDPFPLPKQTRKRDA